MLPDVRRDCDRHMHDRGIRYAVLNVNTFDDVDRSQLVETAHEFRERDNGKPTDATAAQLDAGGSPW
jgi:hypothetical protein